MMDEFDEGMGIAPEEASGSKVGLIAVAVAIVGIVVGVTGIVMANMAQKEVRILEAKLAAEPDKTPELEESLSDIEERLVKLGSEFVKLGRQDRQLQENTQSAFDSVLRDIKANRQGINDVTGKLEEVVEQLERFQTSSRAPAKPEPVNQSNPEAGLSEATTEGDVVYSIQSGDTLSKIASEFNISLSELQNANPSVNPRALQIGQEILIPRP